MSEYIQALTAMNHELSKVVESHQKCIEMLSIKIHQLETSMQTGSMYPLENAKQDYYKSKVVA